MRTHVWIDTWSGGLVPIGRITVDLCAGSTGMATDRCMCWMSRWRVAHWSLMPPRLPRRRLPPLEDRAQLAVIISGTVTDRLAPAVAAIVDGCEQRRAAADGDLIRGMCLLRWSVLGLVRRNQGDRSAAARRRVRPGLPTSARGVGGSARSGRGAGGVVTEVLPEDWLAAVEALKADGFDYFDWLGCVDEIGRQDCLRIVLVVRSVGKRAEPRMLSCSLPRDDPRLDTVQGVFAGAAWHEREVAELFGVEFIGGDHVGCCSTPSSRERRCARMKSWPRALA